MRLATGELFPLPITLDVDKEFSEKLKLEKKLFFVKKKVLK